MTKFTSKQQAFVENKAAGLPNREAAIAAGYGATSAKVTASQLMQRPDIKAAIKAATKGGVDTTTGNAPTMPRSNYTDSKQFLLDVMNHAKLPIAVRAEAAKQLLPYMHARMGETGKKQTKKNNAAAIAGGKHRFATKKPPQLQMVVNNDEP